ncbi:MAG: peptidylprolyl isomerase [Clostridia bacterium]|jgi:peptidyl-prolyl cis-trans isomerase B (cyclophilin B)|nr:peptidylprolyl isomerase [Clostridia bacterium]
MKKISNIITVIALIVIIALIGGVSYGYYRKSTLEVKNPIVTMEVENFGTIKIELYPDMAPQAVSNFVALAKNNFYDGLKFHRVVEDFMIQGGDSKGDGSGSPKLSDLGIEVSEEEDREYCIEGEFLSNKNNNNTLKHKEGIISMARGDYTSYSPALTTESYNSAGSQFFIMTKDNPALDGLYTAFGKVIDGMDVVHKIEKVEVKANSEQTENGENQEENSEEQAEKSTPVNDVIISKVTVETHGVDYGLPKTLEPWSYYDWVYQTYGIDLRSYQQ